MKNILFVLLLFITVNIYAPTRDITCREITEQVRHGKQIWMMEKALNEPFSQELFFEVLKMHVKHPDIVMRQAILETGWFTSKSFTKAGNPFGMKLPRTRSTKAIGKKYGHAEYQHWYYAVLDYKEWQDYYQVNSTTEVEYYQFLDKLPYATAKHYINTLKRINPMA